MLILGIIIGIVMVALGMIFHDRAGAYEIFIIGFLIILVCIVSLLICFNQIGKSKIINDKIKVYREENTKIENQIDMIVKEYMKYEGDTLKEFKSESSITLITIYPELKSDELVKTQVNVYVENNKKIKELKEKRLSYKLAKWWLYFGN